MITPVPTDAAAMCAAGQAANHPDSTTTPATLSAVELTWAALSQQHHTHDPVVCVRPHPHNASLYSPPPYMTGCANPPPSSSADSTPSPTPYPKGPPR
jgi:hypothetical protein